MIGPADIQAQFKSSSSLQCLSCFNLSGKPPPLSYQPECQPATTKRKQKHARRGKKQKTTKTLHGHHRGHHHGHHSKWWPLVIIWSLFQNDVHGHHLMTMTVMAFGMVIIFQMTTMHKNRMMTMVVIFRMTTMAAIPERSWKERRRPWNDDHKEWWPWMMTMAKKYANLINLR